MCEQKHPAEGVLCVKCGKLINLKEKAACKDSDGHWIHYTCKTGFPEPDIEPDWNGKCDNCGQSPIVPATGLCGPCTFGEKETAGGNW